MGGRYYTHRGREVGKVWCIPSGGRRPVSLKQGEQRGYTGFRWKAGQGPWNASVREAWSLA